MADTVSIKTREYQIHHISCNKCGKHICDSEEYDDGWYSDPSEYEQKMCIDGEWYYYTNNLCEDCKSKVSKLLIDMLISHEFVKEHSSFSF